MSTIDEVLAAAEVVDAVCVIDGETRIISIPAEYKELGVESDEKVTRIKFRCPKIVGDNVDLTEYNLYINYRNAGNKLNSYLVEDVTVTGDTINFSWLLSRHVTESPGTISYIVCAKKSDNTGVINEWNTKVATGIVGVGLEATEEIEEQNIDAIEQILRSIVELENRVDSGGSGGSGGYYAPAVDAAGNLTWTASKTDMPAVDGANIKGPQGKSAYAYAVEGGYTGTEAEFAAKLAQEYPDGIVEATGGIVTEGNLVVWDADRSLVRDGGAVPEKLPNPNALTFTGAVTGSYDGSAALTVEIPSGGTDAGRDWAELGVIDFSAVSGTAKLDGLDNYTELLFLWENVKNASATASGYMLKINGIALTAFDAIPIKPEGSSDNYGYTYLRYNGKFWDIRRSNSANAKSNFTLANANALCPYNVALNVGAAASIMLDFSGYQYVATSGTVTIWGR